jgi:hypothetical protein
MHKNILHCDQGIGGKHRDSPPVFSGGQIGIVKIDKHRIGFAGGNGTGLRTDAHPGHIGSHRIIQCSLSGIPDRERSARGVQALDGARIHLAFVQCDDGGTGITTSLTVIVSGELLASDDVAISSVL